MALFVVNRYVADRDEEASAEKAQVLLRRLQERARARERQKRQPGRESPAGSKAPEDERVALASLQEEPKREIGKKREREGPSFGEGRGKKKQQQQQQRRDSEGEALSEKRDGFPLSKSIKNEGEAKTAQERTNTDEGGESESENQQKNASSSEGSSGAREDKNQSSERPQMELVPSLKDPPLPSSSLVLGSYDQKSVQKVLPLLPPWLAQPQLVPGRIKENLVPLQDVSVIHSKLAKKLQANGIEFLFPIQAEVIPAVLESGSSGFLAGKGGSPPSDICVSAPTGSGKTLAFVIPVVQALLDRVVCRVRALVVLPTKELAQQVRSWQGEAWLPGTEPQDVHLSQVTFPQSLKALVNKVTKVFNIYTDGTGLKVVQIAGQKSFAREQEALFEETLVGFRSLADIVVATPGRLVDHLQQSPAFSLRALRFLVIDEADRMMDGMHQNWLQQVVEAAASGAEESAGPRGGLWAQRAEGKPLTAARAFVPQLPLQKLLFSATLTRDPEKLQPLGLFRPRLFMPVSSEQEAGAAHPGAEKPSYALPEGLSQYYVPCSLGRKPLFLLHFLRGLKFSRVLCFTNSKETSHRLFLLLRAFGGVSVAEFSSRLSPSQRKGTLKEFEQGKIQLLISTDATARGIDVASVKCVISYDAPQFLRTYVHRVGRTARAGKAGLAFTLLLKPQESRFLAMLRGAGLPTLERQVVQNRHLQPLLPRYQEALAELQYLVKEERAENRS